jgi:hypothetical protein
MIIVYRFMGSKAFDADPCAKQGESRPIKKTATIKYIFNYAYNAHLLAHCQRLFTTEASQHLLQQFRSLEPLNKGYTQSERRSEPISAFSRLLGSLARVLLLINVFFV